jgi:pyridoxal phosphate enzyme (YggS family)
LMSIAENIAGVRRQIASAAVRAGRRPDDIALMAVSKTVRVERMGEAYDAGLRLFGESRVQEFERKAEGLREFEEAEWHMIGHLQANKAGRAVELFAAVESVDSLRLARRLDAIARQLGKRLAMLIEVNVGGELRKNGVAPESEELDDILEAAPRLEHLEIRGLMTVPPFSEDPQQARPYFRRLRDLQERIAAERRTGVQMDVLSMGMSHDLEVAVEEGSTCVRVGRAIFGARGEV